MTRSASKKKLCFIASILGIAIFIAAISKILHPLNIGKFHAYQAAAGIQLFYCFMLPAYFDKKALWLLTLLALAGTLGFSLYINMLDQLCECFGSAFQVKPFFTFSLSGLLIAGSLWAMKECGCKGFQRWMLLGITAILAVIAGFLIASLL